MCVISNKQGRYQAPEKLPMCENNHNRPDFALSSLSVIPRAYSDDISKFKGVDK